MTDPKYFTGISAQTKAMCMSLELLHNKIFYFALLLSELPSVHMREIYGTSLVGVWVCVYVCVIVTCVCIPASAEGL